MTMFVELRFLVEPEINSLHVRIGTNLVRRAFGYDRAAIEHDHAIGEAEHDVHVVFGEEHRETIAM